MSLNKNHALIIGASSGVGRALAIECAARGMEVTIAARDQRDLDALANHIRTLYQTKVTVWTMDLQADFSCKMDTFNSVFVTAGVSVMEDDLECLKISPEASEHILKTLTAINYTGPAKILLAAMVSFMNRREHTYIGVCSTIAAPLPRSRNLIYAAAKNALESLTKSLQHKAFASSVKIQLFRLGYVDSALSYGQKLPFPAASPGAVAQAMLAAKDGTARRILYIPGYWAWLIFVLKRVPWFIFGRMRF